LPASSPPSAAAGSTAASSTAFELDSGLPHGDVREAAVCLS
jgi:hypothetical protein